MSMLKRFISKVELTKYTKNYPALKAHFGKYRDNSTLGKQIDKLIDANEAHDFANNIAQSLKDGKFHQLYKMEMKGLGSWWGPQGGIPSNDELWAGLPKYYKPSYPDIDDVSDGIKFASELILHHNGGRKLRLEDPVKIITEFTKKSNSGINLWGHKNDPLIKEQVISMIEEGHQDFYPTVIQHRFMRNKTRITFNDDYFNYAIGSALIKPLGKALKQLDGWTTMLHGRYHFDAFIADKYTSQSRTIESDAEAMDSDVNLEKNVRGIVVPVLKNIFEDIFHDWIDEYVTILFNNPLLIDIDVIVEGLHSLLSGQAPTQDFETIIMIVAISDFLIKTKSLSRKSRNLLDDAHVEVIGDDSVIILPAIYSRVERITTPWGTLTWNAAAKLMLERVGLTANEAKQDTNVGSFQYCKRVHSKSAKQVTSEVTGREYTISMRPISLTLNSICHPENISGCVEDNVTRILAILDESFGTPTWPNLMAWIKPRLGILPSFSDLQASVKYVNARRGLEFKNAITNIEFNLENSPSYNYLMGNKVTIPKMFLKF